MKLTLEEMPAEMAAQVTRMHHRMQKWRSEHPNDDATIVWNDGGGKIHVIATIRRAIKTGFVHPNEQAYDMIRAMCEPEAIEPTVSMVRTAIELNA